MLKFLSFCTFDPTLHCTWDYRWDFHMFCWSNFPLFESLSISVEAVQRTQNSSKYMPYQKHCSQTCKMLIWYKFCVLPQSCWHHFDKLTFLHWIRQFLFVSLQLHVWRKRRIRSLTLLGRDYPTNAGFEKLICFLGSNACNHFPQQIMLTSKPISIYLTKFCMFSKLSRVFN